MSFAHDDGWMSTGEVADCLGVTVRTVYRLINSGQLEAFHIGRVIRVQGSEVSRFLNAARVKPGDLDHLVDGAGDS
jgi:excisionase family DNA binding protein